MSTTQNPTFTFPTQTNGNNSGDGDGGGLGSRGANYFFGFLITFVVLLLIFIGCGIGSRRRGVARRNAALVGAYEPWGPLNRDGSQFQTQPELYERLVADPIVEDHWRYTMPLSATYRRGSPEVNPQEMLLGMYDHEMHPDHYEPDNHPAHQQPRTVGQRLRAWIPCLSKRHKEHEVEDAVESEKAELPPPEYLDVAVVIAMPIQPGFRPPSYHSDAEEAYSQAGGGPHAKEHPPVQFHIGTASLPLDWPAELLVRPPPSSPPGSFAGRGTVAV